MKRVILLALLLTAFSGLAKPVNTGIVRYLSGNANDVKPTLHGPMLHLSGGAIDVDEAFVQTIDGIRGCSGTCSAKVDVVVLRSTGADDYNAYLLAMNGVDSVETLVITQRAAASDPEVISAVQNAEFVYFAGGDQCQYVTYFKDTPLEAAVHDVVARGGAVGGISAGLAILGSTVYDACNSAQGVTSVRALGNPYDKNISFTYDFLALPFLSNLVTDSHFVARDRMGRLMTFLARQIQDNVSLTQWGLGINEGTAVLIDGTGNARVVGAGPAYLVFADHPPAICQSRKPLDYSNFKIWKYPAGTTMNLANRPVTGYSLFSVVNGAIVGNPY